MNVSRLAVVTVLIPLLLHAPGLSAQKDPPPELFLLVQSELDYLQARNKRLSLKFENEMPLETILRAIQAGAAPLKVRFEDPSLKKLSTAIELKDVTLKEALETLAMDLEVVFHVPDPHTLVVLPVPERLRSKTRPPD